MLGVCWQNWTAESVLQTEPAAACPVLASQVMNGTAASDRTDASIESTTEMVPDTTAHVESSCVSHRCFQVERAVADAVQRQQNMPDPVNSSHAPVHITRYVVMCTARPDARAWAHIKCFAGIC